jgi:hypothetical protein
MKYKNSKDNTIIELSQLYSHGQKLVYPHTGGYCKVWNPWYWRLLPFTLPKLIKI